jgi:hypothetical protein
MYFIQQMSETPTTNEKENTMNATCKATTESRSHRLFKENITDPGDVLTIKHFGGLSDSITLEHTNKNDPGYTFTKAVANHIKCWKWLKSFNEIGGRSVLVEQADGSTIPYAESIPYAFRFISEQAAREMMKRAGI